MAQPRRTSEVSTVILGVRVTPQERRQIEKAAQAAGMTASAYVRGTALSGTTNRSTRPSTAGAASP